MGHVPGEAHYVLYLRLYITKIQGELLNLCAWRLMFSEELKPCKCKYTCGL